MMLGPRSDAEVSRQAIIATIATTNPHPFRPSWVLLSVRIRWAPRLGIRRPDRFGLSGRLGSNALLERPFESGDDPFVRVLAASGVNDRIHLQLAGIDHLDIDLGVGQSLEEDLGHLSVAPKPDPADGHFDDPTGRLRGTHFEPFAKSFSDLQAMR